MTSGEALTRGEEALRAGRWDEARSCFEHALEQEESADALFGLSGAVWWLGDAPQAVELMERAYGIRRRENADPEAILIAVTIAVVSKKSLGSDAACAGWLARAHTLLGDQDLGSLAGWIAWGECFAAVDPVVAIGAGEQAITIARATGDRDLELCALAELGCAFVAAGRIEDGFALIDESMAAISGREYEAPDTVAAACCAMLEACDRVADLARVAQWMEVAEVFMATYGSPFLYADCRHRHGSILFATGHWQDAERELLAAMRATRADSAYHAQATARLAELRIRQGRLEEAWALLEPVAGTAYGPPVEVALRHARGEFAVAVAIAERWLGGRKGSDGDLARLLEPLAEIRLAQGEVDAAEDVVATLRSLAAGGAARVAAHAALAEGRLAHARAQADAAITNFERAMDLFASCSLPHETARARLALADALRLEQPQVAIAEAQGALSTFERLGATPDADLAAALVRALGGPARTGPKDVGVLTKREQEVLALLAEGLSNPEIATRLFISQKTVSHHVGNVFSKLGVRNRTEAAAYVARAGGRSGGGSSGRMEGRSS